ncbi:hypothetical protein RDWZM_006737 [Blomia tropicalis]|uniref:Uncharacterized protein n=1 Tax=Blomia tropicalis TaxID=40697 RepID=A0A9Q0MC08_BLOTA|nr:hypothetical protein RDWZM_006737 [Blomia tropicalis]
MTLFHLRELWSTNCGTNEEFDKTSMCICNVDNLDSNHDKIVVASYNGTLRVFNISLENNSDTKSDLQGQYGASDMLLEVDLKEPILQIASGVLLSSNNIQLAVLHPTKFCVYSISSTSGATEHGTSYNILLIYEHQLTNKSTNMLLGAFGQIKGKDIVCIQSMNSSLNFYENESFSFGFNRHNDTNNTNRFPVELAYIPNRDLIVMSDNLYNIECYSYQELAMAHLTIKGNDQRPSSTGNNENQNQSPSVLPEWVYSLGETVLELETVFLDNKWFIVILGERNLCVLRENGSLWFVKKFEVNPSCLCSYANESKDALISIVGTHMDNLLIYQNDSLKWATKIPFVPVCIRRGNFHGITGALILLSDEGNLIAGYLGTNPSLKIISLPQTNEAAINTDKMADELKELKKIVSDYNVDGNKSTTENDNRIGLYMDLHLLNFEPINLSKQSDSLFAKATIEITTMVSLKNVKVSFYPNDFFEANPNNFQVEQLEKSYETEISFRSHFPLTLDNKIQCCIVCEKDNVVKMVNKCIRLPFVNIVQRETLIKSHKFWIKLMFEKTFDGNLTLLFEDLITQNNGKEISFHFRLNPQMEGTIRFSTEENVIYQIEGNHVSPLYYLLNELFYRLRSKINNLKLQQVTINYSPIESVCVNIENRLKHRNAIALSQNELEKFSQHYRVLQKRILVKLKDKNPTSLSNFERLLKAIHSKINDNVDRIRLERQKMEHQNYLIWSHLKMIKLLFKMAQSPSASKKDTEKSKIEQFVKLVTIQQMSDFTKNWEERLESNLVEVMQFDRDIGNIAKVLDYESNLMENGQTLRTTLRETYNLCMEQSNCSIQIV